MISPSALALPLDFICKMTREQVSVDQLLAWVDGRKLRPAEELLIVYQLSEEAGNYMTAADRLKLKRIKRELWAEVMS